MGTSTSPKELLIAALAQRRQGQQIPIDLPGAQLGGLQLPASDLARANLRGADFTGTNLAGSCLARADLRDASLIGANLDGADLTDADLRGADLAGARIDDAVFTSARLEGACLVALLGDPLSMTAAKMDRSTVRLSEFSMRDIAEMVVRGAQVDEHESLAPSVAPRPLESDAVATSLPLKSVEAKISPERMIVDYGAPRKVVFDPLARFPSMRVGPVIIRTPSFVPPSNQVSIVPSIRVAEVSARQMLADQGSVRVTALQRMSLDLNALIDAAHIEQAADALSLRPQPSTVERLKAGAFQFPAVGDQYLGVQITEELSPGTSSRCFRGVGPDGERRIVRIFDPGCHGAALHLPAFQRGLRALNKLAGNDLMRVADLVVVGADQTSYVMKDYPEGTFQELVEGSLSLREGLDAMLSLCRSVEEVHERGLMVRSWKPSNLFVDGKEIVIGELDMVHLTTLRQYYPDLSGYRNYAAPEEIVGAGTRSPTADVFSLGKILEYVLTREEPFVPLGGKRVVENRNNIPQVLVDIVKRATEQDPAERYQAVSLLAHDLSVFQMEGDRAVLAASLRPQKLSQLAIPPLSQHWDRPGVERVIQEHKQRVRPRVKARNLSGARQLEIGVALLGGLCGLALFVLLLLVPSTVDKLEGMSSYLAALLGASVFALPPPRSRRIMVRFVTWFVVASALWLVDPLQLASLTWKRSLSSGSVSERAMAVENLARLGRGDFVGADLTGVILSGKNLASVDFTEANLSQADLSSAFLAETRFDRAKLGETRFEGANLFGAQLEGAVDLEEASCDRYTILPEELSCRGGYLSRKDSANDGPGR